MNAILIIMTKNDVYKQVMLHLEEKLTRLDADITSLENDIAVDEKSTAGDKFETAREMAQQEIDLLQTQVQEVRRLHAIANQFSEMEVSSVVESGAVVTLADMHLLVGLPVGPVTLNGVHYTGIGANTPVAQQLLGKSVGTAIELNDKAVAIASVL